MFLGVLCRRVGFVYLFVGLGLRVHVLHESVGDLSLIFGDWCLGLSLI